jgi:hypothetical protein
LFLLPRGRPRRLIPELDPVAAQEAEGSIAWGSIEEEVALEEEGEVLKVSRRLYLKGAASVETSNLSTGIEALHSALQRSDTPS